MRLALPVDDLKYVSNSPQNLLPTCFQVDPQEQSNLGNLKAKCYWRNISFRPLATIHPPIFSPLVRCWCGRPHLTRLTSLTWRCSRKHSCLLASNVPSRPSLRLEYLGFWIDMPMFLTYNDKTIPAIANSYYYFLRIQFQVPLRTFCLELCNGGRWAVVGTLCSSRPDRRFRTRSLTAFVSH